MSSSLVEISRDFQKGIDNYHTTKNMIESMRNDSTINSGLEKIHLKDDIIEINKMINSHKNYHNSLWLGLWYSEEIGNLEPLK